MSARPLKVVSFSHNDLDAMGCQLCIDYKFGNNGNNGNNITYFNTNYFDIKQQVEDCIEYIHRNIVDLIIISDVSFSTTPELLNELIATNKQIIYLDHHLYPENFFTDHTTNNIRYIHDTSKSASQICYDVFCGDNTNSNFKDLIKYINAYDIWLHNEEYFSKSILLNEYFLACKGRAYNIEDIMNIFIDNKYNISIISNFVIEFFGDFEEYIGKSINNNQIFTQNGITLAFIDKYFNYLLYDTFKDPNNKLMVICNTYGVIRVRFNGNSDIPDYIKNTIREECTGEDQIGHLNAFTYIKNIKTINDIIPELQNITEMFERMMNECTS
jgi:hypothetical protein